MTKYSVSLKLSIQALPLFPCVCSPEGRSIVGRYVCEHPGFQRIFFLIDIDGSRRSRFNEVFGERTSGARVVCELITRATQTEE